MPAPAKVLELIGVFERHADEYASPVRGLRAFLTLDTFCGTEVE
jgi:hypothetical protein